MKTFVTVIFCIIVLGLVCDIVQASLGKQSFGGAKAVNLILMSSLAVWAAMLLWGGL